MPTGKDTIMDKTLNEIVAEIELSARCNCDLDNWQPESDTEHSQVCRIHRMAVEEYRLQKRATAQGGE